MKTITQKELDALCQNGQAIESKGGYPAVVIHPDDTVTKFWARKKGFFSSSTISPYSNRFIKNAAELTRRGVIVPEIISHAKLEHSHVRIVIYRSLPGESIRELLKEKPTQVDIPRLTEYIFQLHKKGISFGGMHLGNIIQCPNDQGYGLIDFTDVKFHSKPLSLEQRACNLAVPMRYSKDVQRIEEAGHPSMVQSYLEILQPNPNRKQRFLNKVMSAHK